VSQALKRIVPRQPPSSPSLGGLLCHRHLHGGDILKAPLFRGRSPCLPFRGIWMLRLITSNLGYHRIPEESRGKKVNRHFQDNTQKLEVVPRWDTSSLHPSIPWLSEFHLTRLPANFPPALNRLPRLAAPLNPKHTNSSYHSTGTGVCHSRPRAAGIGPVHPL
jgi:hypothetical protein